MGVLDMRLLSQPVSKQPQARRHKPAVVTVITTTCPCHPQARSKEALQAELGPKLGAQLWDYAHGRDDR